MLIEEVFHFMIIGYCKSEDIDSWWDLSEENKMSFWDKYIYPFFDSKNSAFFLKEYTEKILTE